jgi:ribosomal protein L7/L12
MHGNKHGSPRSPVGKSVRLTGWKRGASAVSAIGIVRASFGTSLAEAKRRVEHVLDGGSECFEADTTDAAAAAVRELQDCGFDAEQL